MEQHASPWSTPAPFPYTAPLPIPAPHAANLRVVFLLMHSTELRHIHQMPGKRHARDAGPCGRIAISAQHDSRSRISVQAYEARRLRESNSEQRMLPPNPAGCIFICTLSSDAGHWRRSASRWILTCNCKLGARPAESSESLTSNLRAVFLPRIF